MTLYCTNPDCPEYGLPKEDPVGMDGAVYCGACGQSVSDTFEANEEGTS